MALLCGKISLFDLKRKEIHSILNYEGQLLPPFMSDMEEYMNCLDIIAECNHIETQEPDNVENQEDKEKDVEMDPDNVIEETEQNEDNQNIIDDDKDIEEDEIIHDDDAPLS